MLTSRDWNIFKAMRNMDKDEVIKMWESVHQFDDVKNEPYYKRMYTLAETIMENDHCVDCMLVVDGDTEGFLEEFCEVYEGEISPFSGWLNEVEDNVYLTFNAKTMRYKLEADNVGLGGHTMVVASGTLAESDFTDFSVATWLTYVICEVNAEHDDIRRDRENRKLNAQQSGEV